MSDTDSATRFIELFFNQISNLITLCSIVWLLYNTIGFAAFLTLFTPCISWFWMRYLRRPLGELHSEILSIKMDSVKLCNYLK